MKILMNINNMLDGLDYAKTFLTLNSLRKTPINYTFLDKSSSIRYIFTPTKLSNEDRSIIFNLIMVKDGFVIDTSFSYNKFILSYYAPELDQVDNFCGLFYNTPQHETFEVEVGYDNLIFKPELNIRKTGIEFISFGFLEYVNFPNKNYFLFDLKNPDNKFSLGLSQSTESKENWYLSNIICEIDKVNCYFV